MVVLYILVDGANGQKANILSPLDFRLSCYIIAMFDLNYKTISNLNGFNSLPKDIYLS
jgi:hypothetical protein